MEVVFQTRRARLQALGIPRAPADARSRPRPMLLDLTHQKGGLETAFSLTSHSLNMIHLETFSIWYLSAFILDILIIKAMPLVFQMCNTDGVH